MESNPFMRQNPGMPNGMGGMAGANPFAPQGMPSGMNSNPFNQGMPPMGNDFMMNNQTNPNNDIFNSKPRWS